MRSLIITDVHIVDPCKSQFGDVLIQDGVIEGVGTVSPPSGVPTLNGEGRTLLPAFVDLHAHFRDPGFPEKEDIVSGSQAAARGGYTAVSLMANTDPVCDQPEVAQYIRNRAKECGVVEIFLVGAVTRGLAGQELADLEGMAPFVWAFSDDGRGVQREDLMAQAGRMAAALGRTILSHCEFSGVDRDLGEELMAARDIWLSRRLGFRLHLTHLSTQGALELVSIAKERGWPVTCDVTPHHLCLPREDMDYTVNPPLAPREGREALVRAMQEGKIEAIATDHAPHTPADKARGAPGISGIETAFPLVYTRLVKSGSLTLQELSRYMSSGPARILGLNKGAIERGYDGDVVLVEEDEVFTVTEEFFYSRGKNSPLVGMKLQGKVWATVHRGEVTYVEGKVKGRDFHDHRQAIREG